MQVSLSPWHDSLGQLAQQHQAHEAGDQDAVAKALQAQNQEIAGNNAGEGKFPELQAATLERVQRRMACSWLSRRGAKRPPPVGKTWPVYRVGPPPHGQSTPI